jgi:hypothetical protein
VKGQRIKEFVDNFSIKTSPSGQVIGANCNIIHIIGKVVGVLLFERFKIPIHCSLKDGWGIAEAESHDCGDKSS